MFEDEFTRLQADIVTRATELAEGAVDDIYVYMSSEEGTSFNVFFRRGAAVSHAGMLNLPGGGPTPEQVEKLFDDGLDAIDRLIAICKQHGHDVPTEVRVTYSVTEERLLTEMRYDEVLSADVGVSEVVRGWMADVGAQVPRR